MDHNTSYDDSSHVRLEIERLSTKLSELNISDDSSTSTVGTSTLSLAVFRDLVEMHDVLMEFDGLVEHGNFVRASASVSDMSRLLVRISSAARGLEAIDTVKLQVSKKRARLKSRLSQLFAESFLVSAEEASVTVKRRHAGVHGHVHYDAPVKISTLLHSMWHVDRQTNDVSDEDAVSIHVGTFLHARLVELASMLSTNVLRVATSDGSLRPESSKGTHWSKIQFVPNPDTTTSSSSSSSSSNTMVVDEVLDRILIVLDFIEVELCPEDLGEDEDDGSGNSSTTATDQHLAEMELQSSLGHAAISIIGEILWSPSGVLTNIVLDVLRNALPTDEQDMPTFDRVIEAARRFEIRLSESGWLASGSDQHFAAFVNDADRQFIQKRRTAILVSTRDMLLQDYHNSVSVEARENLEEDENEHDNENERGRSSSTKKNENKNMGNNIDALLAQQSGGAGGLLSIPKMSVTRCAYRVVETLHAVLKQATSGVGDEHAMVLWQTARDVVEMFRIVIPTAHRDHIATMPRIAMLFYCDCRYIAHHTMVIAHIYRSKLPSPLDRSASMVDLAPPLRSDGASAFVDQIKTQRQELMRMMVRVGDLSCLTDDAIGENAEKAVSGILYHLNKLAKLWGDVLPVTPENVTTGSPGGGGDNEQQPAVFHRAMGALLGIVATELVKRVDALVSSGKDNTHEMQHLLRILVDGAPGIFIDESVRLQAFVPSWSQLERKAGIRYA